MLITEMIKQLESLKEKHGDFPVYAREYEGDAFECDESMIHYENDIKNCVEAGYPEDEYNGPYPFEGFYIGE